MKLNILKNLKVIENNNLICSFSHSELVLKKNLDVMENRSVFLEYRVNDTTYPGPQGTVLLHFNITILPVQIHFTNSTYVFTLSRRASLYAQVHAGV